MTKPAKSVTHSDAAWFKPRKESTWHKLRAADITATASAALFGASPYMTAYDLFHRLAGNIEVVFSQNDRMKWGKRLEPVIAAGICEDQGWEIVDSTPFLYARSPIYRGMGASPDYIIRDPNRPERGLGILEIKNVDKFVALDGWQADEAPVHIEIQLQHQLEACRLGWGAIGGFVGGNDVHLHERDYDAEVGAEIGRRITDMWARVDTSNPPGADYLADADTIKTVYRNATPGKSINLDIVGDDDDAKHLTHIESLIEKSRKANIAKKHAEDDAKAAQAELVEAIGDAESVYGRGWKVSAPTVFLAAQTIERRETSYRRVNISKPKPKAAK